MSLPETAKEYLLNEFNDRRANLYRNIDQIVNDQRYGILATGAFWAWIVTHSVTESLAWLAWVPTLLCVFFLIKWWVFYVATSRLLEYLRLVESKFELPDGLGWSTNFPNYGRDVLGCFTTLFWIVLTILNVLAAVYYPDVPVVSPAK